MDWSQIWQMAIPILVFIAGQVTVWLKAQQAATKATAAANHAQNAVFQGTVSAQHAAKSHALLIQQNERIAALEKAVNQ